MVDGVIDVFAVDRIEPRTLPPLERIEPNPTRSARKSSTLGALSLPTASASLSVSHRHLVVDDNGAAATLRRAGVSERLIQTLDDATVGRFDLYAQILPGAVLDIYHHDDVLVGYRAETIVGEVWATYYAGEVSPAGWYDEKGRSLAGPLRSRPLALTRVTSGFGQRLHPVTGNQSRHTGVDYGAVVGTPVFAVGDADVREAGWSASGGNFLKLAHDSGFESWYLHLNDIAVIQGQKIKQGNLIAHTGNTGSATTGPHLHFELRIANIPLDPQRTVPVPTLALSPRALPAHNAALQLLKETP